MSSTWPPSAQADTIPPSGLLHRLAAANKKSKVIIVAVSEKCHNPQRYAPDKLHGSSNPPEPTTQSSTCITAM